MSWHSDDWAKLGTGFTDWITAHPTATAIIATALAAFVLGAIIF